MKKALLLLTMMAMGILNIRAQFTQIKWYYDTHDSSFGQSCAGDIDHDGKLEIVFGCYRNDSCVYALNAEDGTLLWKYNTHTSSAEGCNDVAPVIYDVDDDDSLEVIVPSSCNPKTFCFRGATGQVMWQTNSAGSDSPPTIGDIDNDTQMEVLHGGFDGHVLCLNALTGGVEWSLPVDENSWVQTAPTLVDLDGDNLLDFVVATWSSDSSRVYAYDGITHALLWQRTLGDWVYHGTAVSDLDNDSRPELVIGSYDGKLYCFNGENGSTKWIYTYNPASYYYVGAPAAIADLNNDGHCEVIFSNLNIVGALSDTGTLIWHYTIPDWQSAFRGVAVAEINGDAFYDVVFGTGGGHVVALKGNNGAQIWDIDLSAQYGDTIEVDHAPLIADFDDNDTIDVFIQGGQTKYPNWQNNYGRAFMFTAGTGNGPPWLMFQHDIRRQSGICNNPFSSAPDEQPQAGAEFVLFPNPAGNTVSLSYTGRAALPDKCMISIYDMYGRPALQQQFPVNDPQAIDLGRLCNGIYMLRLSSGGRVLHAEKFIKI